MTGNITQESWLAIWTEAPHGRLVQSWKRREATSPLLTSASIRAEVVTKRLEGVEPIAEAPEMGLTHPVSFKRWVGPI
jgi:hypothetical protein